MIWAIKDVSKKFNNHNLSPLALLVANMICFFLAAIISLIVFIVLIVFYFFGIALSLLIGILVFVISLPLLSFAALMFIEGFLKLFRRP